MNDREQQQAAGYDAARKLDQKDKEQRDKELRTLAHAQELIKKYQEDIDVAKVEKLLESDLLDTESICIEDENDNEQLDQEDVLAVLELITQLEENQQAQDIIPQQLRITKAEYLQALTDPQERDKTIHKLNNALQHIAQNIQ